MSPEQRARLEEVIERGFPLFSAQCMQMGFKIYRQRFRDFAFFSMIVPLIGSVFTYAGFGWIGTLVLLVIIAPILNAGFYLAANSTVQNEQWPFSRFFDALPQAVPLALNSIISIALGTVIFTPVYFLLDRIGVLECYMEMLANPTNPTAPPVMTGPQSTAFFLNLIPWIYLQVGFSWTFPLILFMGANPLNAFEYSRRLINRAWGTQFWLLFTFFSMLVLTVLILMPIATLNAGLSNILSYGLFLIFPWAYCSLYVGFHLALSPPENNGA